MVERSKGCDPAMSCWSGPLTFTKNNRQSPGRPPKPPLTDAEAVAVAAILAKGRGKWGGGFNAAALEVSRMRGATVALTEGVRHMRSVSKAWVRTQMLNRKETQSGKKLDGDSLTTQTEENPKEAHGTPNRSMRDESSEEIAGIVSGANGQQKAEIGGVLGDASGGRTA